MLRYGSTGNKYMKNYNENKDSSYLLQLDKNSLNEWVMSEKLPANVFKLVKSTNFTNNFIENCNESSSIGYYVILKNTNFA